MGSIFYKKLKKCCFDPLFPHFMFYFFGLGYCDVTIIPRLLCLQMLHYATYSFYIPCPNPGGSTTNCKNCLFFKILADGALLTQSGYGFYIYW